MKTKYQELLENLRKRRFDAQYFATGDAAAQYLSREICATTVGFGGSVTLGELGLYEMLSRTNTVYWHMIDGAEALAKAGTASVYLSSLNAMTQSGELVNIDGVGNRVAATAYGPSRVYFVVGRNKLEETLEQAVWRARNIAAPLNAKRRGAKTPCTQQEPRCYDCHSAERICRELLIHWQKPMHMEKMEILFVDQDLGY